MIFGIEKRTGVNDEDDDPASVVPDRQAQTLLAKVPNSRSSNAGIDISESAKY